MMDDRQFEKGQRDIKHALLAGCAFVVVVAVMTVASVVFGG
jgi:hypothetical protein